MNVNFNCRFLFYQLYQEAALEREYSYFEAYWGFFLCPQQIPVWKWCPVTVACLLTFYLCWDSRDHFLRKDRPDRHSSWLRDTEHWGSQWQEPSIPTLGIFSLQGWKLGVANMVMKGKVWFLCMNRIKVISWFSGALLLAVHHGITTLAQIYVHIYKYYICLKIHPHWHRADFKTHNQLLVKDKEWKKLPGMTKTV